MPKPSSLLLAVGLTVLLCAPAARAAVWRSLGPDGGEVSVVAFAPSDSRVAYAGTLGGVFRSGDGGASWAAASRGLGNLSVNVLAVDPRDPAVVYAGTDAGLYRTTSGGASWTLLPVGPISTPAIAILQIDPVHPRILYAFAVTSAKLGVYRSADGGSHWTERDAGLPPSLTALYADPDHPGTLYAGGIGPSAAIYKTTNGGGSWALLASLPAGQVSAFARQRSTDTVYAATTDGLFAAANGGSTWTLLDGAHDFLTLVVAPSGTLYAGGLFAGVLSSVDGGRTWSDSVPSSPGRPAAQIDSLAADSSGTHFLAGAFGQGIFSLSPGTGWTAANAGLRATSVRGLAVAATGPPLLFAATIGEGVFVSGDGGASFSARNTGLPAQGFMRVSAIGLASSPGSPRSLMVGLSSPPAVAKTSDAGRHWAAATSPPLCSELQADTLAWIPPATMFVASRLAFLGLSCAGSPCTAQVSRDGGATFSCLDGPRDVSAFLVDPLEPAVVYAAAGDAMWKSLDSGEHFQLVASHIGTTLLGLVASPAAHQTLYGVDQTTLLKSTDGGVSWFRLGGFQPLVNALVADPANPSLLYAGFSGVFRSRDGGASWSPLGDGLPSTPVTALALDSVHHVLYAGTDGSSTWALALP
jgi:photosystem II stability/assembly factor-like uncharacterized protein